MIPPHLLCVAMLTCEIFLVKNCYVEDIRLRCMKNTHPMILSSFGSLSDKKYLHCHQEHMQWLSVCTWSNQEERRCGKICLHANDVQSFAYVCNQQIGYASFMLCRNYGLVINVLSYFTAIATVVVLHISWWASSSSLGKTLRWCSQPCDNQPFCQKLDKSFWCIFSSKFAVV